MFILDALNRAIQLPQQLDNIHIAGIVIVLTTYMVLVRYLRYKRKASIEEPYFGGKKSLSEMTVMEAHEVINQLQQLEFPSAFAKARRIALLKVCTSQCSSRVPVRRHARDMSKKKTEKDEENSGQ